MTMRERILAVIRGHECDRVPFVQYSGLAAPDEDIWSQLGGDSMGVIRWSAVHRLESPNCDFVHVPFERNGRRGERTTLVTPVGTLTEEKIFEPTFGTAARSKHFLTTPDDYRVLRAYLEDLVVLDDVDHYRRDLRMAGDDGVPMVAVNRTPYQQMWIQWVCLEDFCIHRAEHPDIVEECMSLLGDIQRRTFDVLLKALDAVDIPFVDVPDNITAPPIGLDNFRRYCVPYYDELADMLSDRGIPVFVHMDGDLMPLRDAIRESKIGGLDSFSPWPDNDTRPGEAASMWPDMRLFMNYPSSVHLWEPAEIYEHTLGILNEIGHTGRLQLQVSENVPPHRWRVSFPEIVRAIDDFGKP